MTDLRLLEAFSVGDRVGIITYGRRSSYVVDGTVAKLTPRQIVVGCGTLTYRFDRSDGTEIGRGGRRIVSISDPRYIDTKALQDARNELAADTATKERAARDSRFAISKIVRSEGATVERVLHTIAAEALKLESTIQLRLDRLTPQNLYRELSWLTDSGVKSAQLDWYLDIFRVLVERPEDKTVAAVLVDYRNAARVNLLRPYSTIFGNIEEQSKLIANREVYETLKSILAYTLDVKE